MKKDFPKKLRILSNDEFRAVIANRRRFADNLLTVYAAPNKRQYGRLGVSIGKSSGNAVVRNRFKRLLREVFRQNLDCIPAGFDYVVIGSSRSAKQLSLENVRLSFLKLAQRVEQ